MREGEKELSLDSLRLEMFKCGQLNFLITGEYEDETEDETEDEEVDQKEAPVKTLVGEMPPEKSKGDEITKDEPSSSGAKVG